jgi:argininosuccinate lyase
MALAKTEAAGSTGLLPEVLAFSSSLSLDIQLLKEDIVGSLAHLTMLSRTGILPKNDAQTIKKGLIDIFESAQNGTLTLPDEEDVHMAVEAQLSAMVGEPAGRLHTARSRNDQVALDLRLHVREMCAQILREMATLVDDMARRAEVEKDTVLPSYTHRQRAIPVSLGYWFSGFAQSFVRDAEAFRFVLEQTDTLPLGVGAIAGTSLPIDRQVTQSLLRFSKISQNGLDTVGDRDFATDFTYAASRFLIHASRLSTDLIDFSSGEFGFVKLDGNIACGSSMMPQKRNPDVFELIRGKTGRAVGNLVGLLMTLKGLPGGYNRDLQEDRQALLETGPLVLSVIRMLKLALPRCSFDKDACRRAIENDATQATDLAEALVKKGLPFRQAYKAVGSLVRRCQEAGIALGQVTLEFAQKVDGRFDAEVLLAQNPLTSVSRKQSFGSTGPDSLAFQFKALQNHADTIMAWATQVPSLEGLFQSLKEASL